MSGEEIRLGQPAQKRMEIVQGFIYNVDVGGQEETQS